MLTLTATDKKSIANLIQLAKKKPVPLDVLKKAIAGDVSPIGDDPRWTVDLKAGKQRYRVVYSHEEQRIGLMRHISISSDKTLKLEDVNDILRRFGFDARLFNLDRVSNPPLYEVWLEPISANRAAFNVLEVISDGGEH